MKTFIIETFEMSDSQFAIVRKMNGEPVKCIPLFAMSDSQFAIVRKMNGEPVKCIPLSVLPEFLSNV